MYPRQQHLAFATLQAPQDLAGSSSDARRHRPTVAEGPVGPTCSDVLPEALRSRDSEELIHGVAASTKLKTGTLVVSELASREFCWAGNVARSSKTGTSSTELQLKTGTVAVS